MTLKGVAWRMSGPSGSLVLAVVGRHIVIASREGEWRSGVYGTTGDADKYAATMTRHSEDGGMKLDAGPVAFASEARIADADSVGADILKALDGE